MHNLVAERLHALEEILHLLIPGEHVVQFIVRCRVTEGLIHIFFENTEGLFVVQRLIAEQESYSVGNGFHTVQDMFDAVGVSA